jgi:hypothetical protein
MPPIQRKQIPRLAVGVTAILVLGNGGDSRDQRLDDYAAPATE